jgi:hypothetical protein
VIGAMAGNMSVTFFMLVTSDDWEIAIYSIRSFIKVLDRNPKSFLLIYCNGLSPERENRLRLESGAHPRMLIKSNAERLKRIEHEIVPGKYYLDDSGRRHLREGRYEAHDEVLTRELVKIESDLVGIVDADFEVLDASFVSMMVDEFSKDPSLAFYSTDYDDTHYSFETCFQKWAFIEARFHTWFCLFRRSALDCYCDFAITEKVQDGQLHMYDTGAELQRVLTEKHGYRGKSLDRRLQRQYVHYSQFSKNRSLKGRSLRVYRCIRISRRNGWLHKHRVYPLAFIIRVAAHFTFQLLGFSRFDKERTRFLWD